MREVYTDVLERLLMVHYETGEEKSLQSSQVLVNNEDSVNSWPPWPWPPWGDDDDGNGGGDRPGSPKNATQLAEEVVKFERKLAQASLDLSGHFEKKPNPDADSCTETSYTRILYTPTTRFPFPTSLRL